MKKVKNMQKFKKIVIAIALFCTTSLSAITVYYNGEGDDVGAWSILQPGSIAAANLTEVYDEALHSRVMNFTDGGIYALRMPGQDNFWRNATERILSFDMNMDSEFTVAVFVETENGPRSLFYNRLNLNAGHHNNVANRNILGGIGHHRLFRFSGPDDNHGWEEHPEFRNNRDGWVRVTLDLEDQLLDIEPDNRIISVFSMRITGTAGRIDNVTLDTPAAILPRGQVANNWVLTPNTPAGGTVALVQDNPERGNVIEFNGAVGSNSFTTGARVGANRWNLRGNEVVQWKMQTEDPFKFIVHTRTANGPRDLVYHGGKRRSDMFDDRWFLRSMDAIEERGFDANTNEIRIGLGIRRHLGDASPNTNNDFRRNAQGELVPIPDYDSGTGPTWQSFIRNIATDLLEFDNMNRLLAVNGVTVIGTDTFEHNSPMIDSTIRVDDIQFFGAVVPTGIATHLTRWRLRDNSVRIAFRDNSNGEVGFRFINADTGDVMGNPLPATNGVGTNSIGQINGLIAGTNYQVQVETIFNDGRDNMISLPFAFRTTGNPPNVNSNPADDLHFWRRRENSFRISFRDNSEGEIGFRFINADTGAVMGNQLAALNGAGEVGIGPINGLNAGTTYRVRVETLFANAQNNNMSQPITVRTLGGVVVVSDPADDLHFWRRRENSFRISFRDNSEGEVGFRFINADTGAVMGNQLAALNGVGDVGIGQINGLNAGTTYRVRVETLFANAQNNNMSQPITVRTLGGVVVVSNPADDLHFWRRRATSVRISFRDNSEGEIGFRYINANTGAVMGNQVNPVAGAGTATIGTINGLTPATTYQVRVETLFTNAQNNSMSQPITFTTRP